MPLQVISYLTNVLRTHLVYCIVIAHIVHKIIQSQVMNDSGTSLYKRIIVINVLFFFVCHFLYKGIIQRPPKHQSQSDPWVKGHLNCSLSVA